MYEWKANLVYPYLIYIFRSNKTHRVMKKITALGASMLIALASFAQLPASGGPDQFGYTFKNSTNSSGPTYQWFDISTTGTLVTGLSDDNFVGPFPISGFPYYTSNPTQFWIGSNGFISFVPVNIASTAASFPAIPTAGGPNNFIAPFLSDLTFGGATSNPAKCYRYDQGDTVCISFVNVPFWVNNGNQYGGDNSFQIILNRADSSITFNYQKQVGAPDPVYVNNYISIGIENPVGNDGLQYYRGATTPIINTSVKFEYPTIIQPVTDIEVNWITNEENRAEFITSDGSFTPVANIKNVGNQPVNSTINISYTIENSFGSLVNLGFTSIPSLGTGQDTTLVLGSAYAPNASDKFVFTSYVSGVTADVTKTNDTASMFFKSVDTTGFSQNLDYSDGVATGSLGWSGGNGGVAVYFEPPYYPARVLSTNFYISTLGSPPMGFYSLLYDDANRTTIQGNLIDSAYIPASAITTGTYHTSFVNSNVIISSGGVYLHWLMEGDGINIGTSTNSPASNNTYEVLFGSWSNYRSASTQDFLMGIEIEPLAVGVEDSEVNSDFSVYPNPATDFLWVNTNRDYQLSDFSLRNVSGQQVPVKMMKYDDKLKVLRGNLPSGTYFLNYKNTATRFIFSD